MVNEIVMTEIEEINQTKVGFYYLSKPMGYKRVLLSQSIRLDWLA